MSKPPMPPGSAPAPVIILKPPTSGVQKFIRRVGLYGPAGVGKSTLAALLPDSVTIDTEHETGHLAIADRRIASNWSELMAIVQDPSLPGKHLIIDNASKVEQFCVDWTVENIPKEKGGMATNVENYGYGKGYRHVYDTWITLLAALDRQADRGKHIVFVMHETIETVPNPMGDDFIRYEPRIQKQRNGPVQSRTVEWLTDIFFIGYDVVASDGIGKGAGTRTIYGKQRPAWIAKSRPARADRPWNDPTDNSFWKELIP